MRIAAVLACVSLAFAQTEAVKFEYFRLQPAVIQSRLESVKVKITDRRGTLEAFFHEAGCDGDNFSEKPIPHVPDPNLVCVLPGATSSVILVGGHYDAVDRGTGAVDDWSGAVMLPSLYQSLKSKPRKETFVFVAFAGEERGLLGSRAFVKELTTEGRKQIHAMINLECLGTSPPKVWATRADKRLLGLYVTLATAIGVKPEAFNVDRVGDDDSHPFLDAKIPVLTIHSINQQTLAILHSAKDNLTAIHPDEYYAAYRLAVSYLALLDQTLE